MDAIVGSGTHTYDVNVDWARVPDGIDLRPAAVAVDSARPGLLLQSLERASRGDFR